MITPHEYAEDAARSIRASRARRHAAVIAQRRHRARCAALTPLALLGAVLVARAITSTSPPTIMSTVILGIGFGCVLAWVIALTES